MKRMKGRLIALLCAELFALDACAAAEQTSALSMAQAVLTQLTAGEYAQIAACFDETMAQAVDETALEGI